MKRKALAVIVLTILSPSSSALGLATADTPGFICPDHTVVTTAEQCPTLGNKVTPTGGGPGSFPGGGGGSSGGGGSGGLLGIVGGALHSLTGGLL